MRLNNSAINLSPRGNTTRRLSRRVGSESGFTMLEIVIVSGLVLVLVIATWNALFMLDRSTRRMSEYTSALAMVQGKIEQIRATTYNPPAAPFTASTSRSSETVTIALDKHGTNFLVAGTMITVIEPTGDGHMVTINASFTNMSQPYFVEMQTIVNAFSGGEN